MTTTASQLWTVARQWAHRRRDPLLRYLLPALVGAALPLLWFRPDRFFATGDVGPFVRDSLGAELGSVWGHQVSGAGGPSYEVARLPDLLLIRLCEAVGLGPEFAQALLYALILGGCAAAVAFLASVWLRRPGAAATAGVLSVANVYVLVSLLNPLPVLAAAVTALLVGQVLQAAQGRTVRVSVLALSTLPLCCLGMNPPLLAVVALGTAAATAGCVPLTGGTARPALLLVGRALPVLVCLQLWWLVPELISLQSAGGGSAFSAQTNAAAWAWTQTRNSLGNIVALNANWGWNYSEYYPFAAAMDRPWWAVLRWAPPLLAGAGALLPPGPREVRRGLRLTALAGLVLVLLCKGLHPPLAGLNAWLYAQVPGMWLFREPMSKFGVLLVLVSCVLAGAAVERGLDAAPRPVLRHGRGRALRVWAVLPCAGVLAAAVYPYPLWTGAVVTQSRAPLPSASVAVPAGWHRLADTANASGNPGKVLELPLQDYYQVLTDWGFHGADTVPQQLLRRPLLQRLPGGYFDATPQLAQLMSLAESGLGAGDPATALGALRALDVDQVIVRRDLVASPGGRPTADPDRLAAGLRRIPGARLARADRVGDLYRLPPAPSAPTSLTLDDPADPRAAAEAAAHGGATSSDPWIPVTGARFTLTDSAAHPFTLGPAAPYRITVDDAAGTGYRMSTAAGRTELLPTARLTLDGAPFTAGRTAPLGLDGGAAAPTALLVDGNPLSWRTDGPLTLRQGQLLAAARATGPQLMAPSDHQSTGGCGSAPADTVTRDPAGAWQLRARQGTACVRLPLRNVPGTGLVSVTVHYRTLTGTGPRVCLWQQGPDRCATEAQLPAAPGRRTWTTAVRIAPGTQALALYGYTDAVPGGEIPGEVVFDSPSAHALAPGAPVRVPGGPAPAQLWNAGAGAHRFQALPVAVAAPSTGFTGLQDCARRDRRTARQSGLLARPLPDNGVHLEASAHAACVTALTAPPAPGSSYRLHLRYRTVHGSPARICLWQAGPDSCAELPPPADTPAWTTLDTTVALAPGTHGLTLYLYADGQDAGTTSIDYDQVVLTPALPPVTLAVTAATAASPVPAPHPAAARPNGGARALTLTTLHGSALFALTESYDSRWVLSGLPAGWTARPLQIDGFRQAWLVTGHGDARLTARFGPDRWWYAALLLSLGSLLTCCSLLLRGRLRPLGPGRLTRLTRLPRIPRPVRAVPASLPGAKR